MKKKFSLPLCSSVCWRLYEHQSLYFVHKWTEQNKCPFDNIFMTQWFRFLIDHLSVILFTFISNLNAYCLHNKNKLYNVQAEQYHTA